MANKIDTHMTTHTNSPMPCTSKKRGLTCDEEPVRASKRPRAGSNKPPPIRLNDSARHAAAPLSAPLLCTRPFFDLSEYGIPALPQLHYKEKVAAPDSVHVQWTLRAPVQYHRVPARRHSLDEPRQVNVPVRVHTLSLQPIVLCSVQQTIPKAAVLHSVALTNPTTSNTPNHLPKGIPAPDSTLLESLRTQIPKEILPLAVWLYELLYPRECPETDVTTCECHLAQMQGWSSSPTTDIRQHILLTSDAAALTTITNFHTKIMHFVEDYMTQTWSTFAQRFPSLIPTPHPSRTEYLRVLRTFYLHEICTRKMALTRRQMPTRGPARGFVEERYKVSLDASWRHQITQLAAWEAEQLFCVATYLRGVFDALLDRELDRARLRRLEDGMRPLPPDDCEFQGMALLYRACAERDPVQRERMLEAADRGCLWVVMSQNLGNFLRTVGGHRTAVLWTGSFFRDDGSGAQAAWRWALGKAEWSVLVGRRRTAEARRWGYVFLDRERLVSHGVLTGPFVRSGGVRDE
ncbi:hypothetical protein ASPACDRAFT_1859314 [Aspergillus aculeatus ATCC 16872]|uniref:Uncharacterized protein n=1 Tax=Aspergillus aculeatus (strain ATCC 16872 / CBS 172.66 / WB 5094) TaxID=690307 RepID=A0A1L9WKF5_ASPA1|nr:uncharacterized protein ASPACDRAFT_1859314 [Aspergillus aculeatus ATCC 16872]OJJ96641.1 hypothetical protein ASPACDRAFT_1859314 [Aspergillus aculeatus ATCC 16872]